MKISMLVVLVAILPSIVLANRYFKHKHRDEPQVDSQNLDQGPVRTISGGTNNGYGNQGRLDPVPRPGGGGFGGTNRGPAANQSPGYAYVDRGQLTQPYPPGYNGNRKTGY